MRRLDNPRKIRGLYLPIRNRACDAKTCLSRMNPRGLNKLGDNLVQPGVMPAGEDGCSNQAKLPVTNIKKRQPCVGTSDVASQNHLSKFLQCRPSRSSNSSESFGPQL